MIVIVTQSDCPLCHSLRNALAEADVPYTDRPASSLNAAEHAILTADAEGSLALPILLAENGDQYRGSAAISYVEREATWS